MEQDRKLVRPPFDSDGNVVWTTEEKPMKKKALQWWVWLIPVGLICVIGICVLIYRSANRRTPQELCRDALRDALEESVGYREPMMKVMRVEELAGYLRDMPTEVGLSLQLQNTNMTLADLGIGSAENTTKLSDYRGMGLTFLTVYDGKASSVDVRFAVSALSLSVIQARYEKGELLIASPKLIKEVLSVPVADVSGQWKQAAAWTLLEEADREAAQKVIGLGVDYGSRAIAILKSARDTIVAAYPGGESQLDRIVDAISYEQLKDDKGKELTERIVVGSEKIPCYVFQIQVDEQTFYDVADRLAAAIGKVAGGEGSDGSAAAEAFHNAWKLDPQPDGGNGVKVLAYVTKDGELAQITADVNGFVNGKTAHFTAKLRCMGSEDPQDKLFLTINGDVDGQLYELSAKKTTKADRSRVSSQFDISLMIPGRDTVGLTGTATYNISAGILEVTTNITRRGMSVATLELSADCTYKNSWSMKIRELTYRDRGSGNFLTLYGQFAVSPSRDGVLNPEGEKINLLTMPEEKAKEIKQEAIDQVNWYMKQFFR